MDDGLPGKSCWRLAIGPRNTSFGSWNWLGADLADSLKEPWTVSVFDRTPDLAEVVLFIKFLPALAELQDIASRSRIVYCPVDFYTDVSEIEHDHERLALCHAVVVHAPRLLPYFQSYTSTVCFDHHLKFVIPAGPALPDDGPILWVGVRSNLAPLVDYVNRQTLPAPLVVLTNPESARGPLTAADYGFHSRNEVRVESWSPEAHLLWLQRSRAAIDIKGDDFRARHKPAAKALDYLASGIPLAMNPDASSVEAVRQKGFEIVSPDDPDRWFSADYAAATRQFGAWLTAELSLTRLTAQWHEQLQQVMTAEGRRTTVVCAVVAAPMPGESAIPGERQTRVALVSALFNWPSTGGGTVHTAEAARFLSRAGYDVRHFVLQHAGWGVGQVSEPVDWPMELLTFADVDWRRERIEQRLRQQVAAFAPDAVIVTDSWNLKPRLAAALQEWPCYLRLAAQECLCPLNNVRLLWEQQQGFHSCPHQQLASPDVCRNCVQQQGRHSGGLHRAERELAGFLEADYETCLQQAFAGAAGVLVVNPEIAEQVRPYARQVHVIPSGFDPDRFPPPRPPAPAVDGRLRLLFAGLVQEPMKGFSVLHEACQQLYSVRQDFWLVATADPPGTIDEFTEFVGWQSQADLPRLMQQCDVVVCPTIAEEALGRTAVEGMAAGRPVVASQIGGLPYTVIDEGTGLLCKPGDPADLARQLARLLDDAGLRQRMGAAGRQRFETHYTWPVILERDYRPLLGGPIRPVRTGGAAL